MAQAKWDCSLETGNDLIDAQHRETFSLVNELHDSIVERRSREEQDAILNRVLGHVGNHFADEEALMRSIHYPGLARQMTLHKEFAADAGRLSEKYRSGESLLPITLAVFLYDWLITRIRIEDRKIGEFIRESRG